LRVFAGALPAFETASAPEHPAELFLEWLLEAIEADVREPHAMTLSTVDPEGRPTSRVLILKGLADGQWQFATSRTSRKGRELEHSPWAAACFYWPKLGRQVRLRGRVLDAGREEAARDFLARPEGSRAESLVGHQSEILDDPADLDVAIEQALAQVSADAHAVPEHWALYGLLPDEVEFWQADAGRRHTRLRYELAGTRWDRRLLWP
jgi:pyridoxamine 5'-phosphate oxidase